jgi:hypothetical protein
MERWEVEERWRRKRGTDRKNLTPHSDPEHEAV